MEGFSLNYSYCDQGNQSCSIDVFGCKRIIYGHFSVHVPNTELKSFMRHLTGTTVPRPEEIEVTFDNEGMAIVAHTCSKELVLPLGLADRARLRCCH